MLGEGFGEPLNDLVQVSVNRLTKVQFVLGEGFGESLLNSIEHENSN